MYVIKTNYKGVIPMYFSVSMMSGEEVYDPITSITKSALFDSEKDAIRHRDRLRAYFDRKQDEQYRDIRVCSVSLSVNDVKL